MTESKQGVYKEVGVYECSTGWNRFISDATQRVIPLSRHSKADFAVPYTMHPYGEGFSVIVPSWAEWTICTEDTVYKFKHKAVAYIDYETLDSSGNPFIERIELLNTERSQNEEA